MSRIATLVLVAALAPAAWAAPYVPADDAQVLERLPVRPGVGELRDLRRRLAAEPRNAELASALANRYYRIALREGDPRFVGYAQAALAPWARDPQAPPGVLVSLAALAQYLHRFDEALDLLGRALARDPDDASAWSLRAVIYIVLARYDEARADCRQLAQRSPGLLGAACEPTVEALTGRAASAYDALRQALARWPEAPANERLWAITRLAEMAQRLGRPEAAEAHFREALALGITDQYLLAVRAEFLLDQGRPREAVELLRERTRNDVLLLRLALAEKALGMAEAAAHEAQLRQRIDAARLRGDKLHLADEAIFELVFRGRATEAARLARENWELGQREPGDARILLEAALAAKQPALARPALDWLARTGHEDRILAGLARRLAGRP